MRLVLLFLFWNLVTEDYLLGWIVWISIQILDKSVRNLWKWSQIVGIKSSGRWSDHFLFFSLGRVYLPSPE